MPKASTKGLWTTLDVQVARRRDGVEYMELLRSQRTSNVVRLRLRADVLAVQCFAVCELWTGSKWEDLHYLVDFPPGFSELALEDPEPTNFDGQRSELLCMATFILGA